MAFSSMESRCAISLRSIYQRHLGATHQCNHATRKPTDLLRKLNALQRATQAQLLPWRCEGIGAWSTWRWLSTVWRLLALSRSAQDWLRMLCYCILLPVAFIHPLTGETRGFWGFVSARVVRLRNRLGEHNSSNPTTNASLPEADSKPKEVVARSN